MQYIYIYRYFAYEWWMIEIQFLYRMVPYDWWLENESINSVDASMLWGQQYVQHGQLVIHPIRKTFKWYCMWYGYKVETPANHTRFYECISPALVIQHWAWSKTGFTYNIVHSLYVLGISCDQPSQSWPGQVEFCLPDLGCWLVHIVFTHEDLGAKNPPKK